MRKLNSAKSYGDRGTGILLVGVSSSVGFVESSLMVLTCLSCDLAVLLVDIYLKRNSHTGP